MWRCLAWRHIISLAADLGSITESFKGSERDFWGRENGVIKKERKNTWQILFNKPKGKRVVCLGQATWSTKFPVSTKQKPEVDGLFLDNMDFVHLHVACIRTKCWVSTSTGSGLNKPNRNIDLQVHFSFMLHWVLSHSFRQIVWDVYQTKTFHQSGNPWNTKRNHQKINFGDFHQVYHWTHPSPLVVLQFTEELAAENTKFIPWDAENKGLQIPQLSNKNWARLGDTWLGICCICLNLVWKERCWTSELWLFKLFPVPKRAIPKWETCKKKRLFSWPPKTEEHPNMLSAPTCPRA